jgi:hypothetical protein
MAQPPEVLKQELGKIKKKLASINKELKKMQSKNRLEKENGSKKDAKNCDSKVRDLLIAKHEFQSLRDKVEQDLQLYDKRKMRPRSGALNPAI